MTALTLRRCCLPCAAGLLSLFLASCGSTKPPKSGYSDVVDYTTPHTNLSQEEYPFDKEGNYLADVVSGKKKGKPASSYSSYSKPEPEPNPYLETYEKPVITAVDTPPERPNPIYERVPEPDTPPSSSSSGSSSGSSSSSRPKATASASSSKPKPKSTATASASSSKSKSGSSSKTASSSKSKSKPKAAPAKPKGLSYASYKVKNKDTLYSLAGRYNTTVSAIKKANGMSSNTLVNGRTIRIPRN